MRDFTYSVRRSGPLTRASRGLGLLVLTGWAAGAFIAVLVTLGLTHLLQGEWPWRLRSTATPPGLLDILKVGLSVVAGMGGVVALVVAYRRQQYLERDEAGRREEQKAYRDRYAAA